MVHSFQSRFRLNNGVMIPYFGMGVFQVTDQQHVPDAIQKALEVGYRSFDTGAVYNNEKLVGKAIGDSDVARDELFISSKIWNGDQGYENVLKAFEHTLANLGVDYLDMYLIHWPLAEMYTETWRAMERLYEEKMVRAIGVANFKEHHLANLFVKANVKPAIDQVEMHPFLPQNELRTYLAEQGIAHGAWSPLAKGALFQNPVIGEIAKKHGVHVDQVILRWHMERDTITMLRSISAKRMFENTQIFDFTLDADDMKRIGRLENGKRVGPDPDDVAFMMASMEKEREMFS
ncbi:aldo/keto reductase [Listeria riparia]|uniref:Oxidoreductase, aldo/keto reductase family protein n=1 Tax=Listeria riparia FSL S10-1204 TaxID=1265816 RepID=W7D034_9LIST|nr:aldo/keto reductase [Listeria riparia]EUJ42385.1 oxidoreductase, aldo/keto reductase family protein [Listeria riparia FSL S10-1204]